MAASQTGQTTTAAPGREEISDLLGASLAEGRARPSRAAVSYLLNLLEAALRSPGGARPPSGAEPGLAEALRLARRIPGAQRFAQLRALGDRALAVAGLFGERLDRSGVDVAHYRQVGSAAYGELARCLAGTRRGGRWARLFRELGDDFLPLSDLIAGVGDRAARQTAAEDELSSPAR
ncbi:MAG: hypothetical protein ACQGVK_15160 [Myxococcota bacterium]